MRTALNTFCGIMLVAFASPAFASQLTVASKAPLAAGKPTELTLKLSDIKGAPITLAKLKEVHTKKIHLLVIDPSLSDYHHIHPVAGKKAGEYHVAFTPRKEGGYIVYADITPIKGEHEYLRQELGSVAPVSLDKTTSLHSVVDGYDFTLELDGALKAGDATMARITVKKDGKPVVNLEPVMGAFAHLVGFSEDLHSVIHVHPMGTEPTKMSDRGGPTLEFHVAPEKSGFIKLFAQIKVGNKEIFAPFSLTAE